MSGKFCSYCHRKNKVDATHCAYCGKPFSTIPDTTRPVTSPQPDITEPPKHLDRVAGLPASVLALFISGVDDPVIIQGSQEVILGRKVVGSPENVLDLAKYDVGDMGVSRQHARLNFTGDACSIQDLNSTNGTWVNEARLVPGKSYPLRSGDQIRLGQFKLYVYFHSGSASEEEILFLVEMGSQSVQRQILTPYHLATTVTPYLQALVDLQYIIEEIKMQGHRQIGINTISAVKLNAPIGVSLDGARDAIQMVRDFVIPWRREHAAQIASQAQSEKAVGSPPAKDETPKTDEASKSEAERPAVESAHPPTVKDKPPSEVETKAALVTGTIRPVDQNTPERRLEQAQINLALKIVLRLNPGLPDEDRVAYATRLLFPLKILTTSTLELSSG